MYSHIKKHGASAETMISKLKRHAAQHNICPHENTSSNPDMHSLSEYRTSGQKNKKLAGSEFENKSMMTSSTDKALFEQNMLPCKHAHAKHRDKENTLLTSD